MEPASAGVLFGWPKKSSVNTGRAPSRAQSALSQAMQDMAITNSARASVLAFLSCQAGRDGIALQLPQPERVSGSARGHDRIVSIEVLNRLLPARFRQTRECVLIGRHHLLQRKRLTGFPCLQTHARDLLSIAGQPRQ